MKKKYLLMAIILLNIGFATVVTTLFITGGARISSNSDEFNVYFSKVKVDGVEDNSLIVNNTNIEFEYEFKTIGDKKTIEYDITNGSSNYDAKVSVNCVSGNEYLSVVNNWVNDTVIKSTETETGKVEVKLIKAYEGAGIDYDVTCEISVNASEKDIEGNSYLDITPTRLYTLIADANSNGIADIGDEIQVTGTNENFYVISNDGININALAKYNLNAGNMCTNLSSCTPIENPTYKQDEAMTGVKVDGTLKYGNGSLAFSDNNGWPYSNNDTIDIQAYDGPVKTAINAYKAILPEGIEVRLITKAEIEALVNDGDTFSYGSFKDKADAKGVSWLYSTSYWSGSDSAGSADRVWIVGSNGDFSVSDFDLDYYCGVRPVISLES